MIKLLLSIDSTRNRARFYCDAVEATLLGDVCVTRCWGRIGGARQQLAPVPFADVGAALVEAEKVVSEKMKRGYVER